MILTLDSLIKLCEKHNIPKDVELYSDSGWECSASPMNEAFYNQKRNVLVFTTENFPYEDPNCEDWAGRFSMREEPHPEDWKHLEL